MASISYDAEDVLQQRQGFPVSSALHSQLEERQAR